MIPGVADEIIFRLWLARIAPRADLVTLQIVDGGLLHQPMQTVFIRFRAPGECDGAVPDSTRLTEADLARWCRVEADFLRD